MTKKPFGKYAKDVRFKRSPMQSQYMWWNWQEDIQYDKEGKYKDIGISEGSSGGGSSGGTGGTW